MDAPTGRSTSSQRSESQEDASGLLSSFDLTSLSNEHVMATVRRRRAATEQGNHPQACHLRYCLKLKCSVPSLANNHVLA
jgi:hypothetical protein